MTTPPRSSRKNQEPRVPPLSELHEEAVRGGGLLCILAVFRWGFGLILFFIKNLEMGDFAPFFIDMEPGEEASWD